MAIEKKIFPKVTAAAAAAFDPLQNFETVLYTGNGSTKKVNGYIRKGAAFNGSSSRIDLPNNPIGTNLIGSVSLFVQGSSLANSTTTVNTIFYNRNPYVILYTYSNNLYFTVKNSSSVDTSITYALSNFNTTDWYNITATLSGLSSTMTLYVNGSSVGTATAPSSILNVASTAYIGHGGSSIYWNGKIDQVRFFNTAITDTSKISQLAAEDYSKDTKSTTDIFGDGSGVALYEFEEDALSSNFGQAASFNGSSSKIDYTSSIIPSSGGFSISWWMKWNGDSDFAYLFDTAGGGATNGFYCIIHDTLDEVYWNFKNGSYGTNISVSYPVSERTEWTHFVITWDGTTSANAAKIYKNNVATSGTQTVTQAASGQNFKIGYSGTEYFNGQIDQVRIFNTALGSSDVTKLYNESSQIPTANLIAHYKLDGNAEDVLDTYDGTATNVTYTNGVYGGTATNVDFLGMSFAPDLVWAKSRGSGSHVLTDVVRGDGKEIYSDLTNQEGTVNRVALNSNGFTVTTSGYLNSSGVNHVAWCWKAGGAAVSDTGTNVTNVEVSANQDAGFSIVKYTGSSSNATVPHGLSQPPEFIMIKDLTTSSGNNWCGSSEYIGTGWDHIFHFDVNLQSRDFDYFLDTAPTSSVFSLKGGIGLVNNTSTDYIAYCWHSVVGYQKVGYFNQVSGTTTVSTGFRPRFLILKRTDDLGDWYMFDSLRGDADLQLLANENYIEGATSGYTMAFNDDGFVLTIAAGTYNIDYFYLAIA